jgi:hypothetical protein
MRRIIERTWTIVTTTTWTISWQEYVLHLDPEADPDADDFPELLVLQEKTTQHIRQFPTRIETKEVDVAETEKVIDQTADQLPPDDPYFYQSRKGNEKP